MPKMGSYKQQEKCKIYIQRERKRNRQTKKERWINFEGAANEIKVWTKKREIEKKRKERNHLLTFKNCIRVNFFFFFDLTKTLLFIFLFESDQIPRRKETKGENAKLFKTNFLLNIKPWTFYAPKPWRENSIYKN